MKQLITLDSNPDVYIVNQLVSYLSPQKIYVPIINSNYNVNDYIKKNTRFSSCFSSVSGLVSKQKKVLWNNEKVIAYEINNNYKEESISKIKYKKPTDLEEFKSLLEKYILNNILDKINKKEKIDKLIISSVDEEEYTLKEFIILANFHKEILATCEYLLKIFNIDEITLVTKNINAKSIRNVKSIIGTYPSIDFKLLPDKYLLGYDEYLCEYLNTDINNTLVLKTSDIYNIYNSIIKGKNITETILTISGDAITKSFIINTKIGVSLKEIIDNFIKFNTKEFNVYVNGYLKGDKIKDYEDIIITSSLDCIVFKSTSKEEEDECINCGACNKICPVNINVLKCLKHTLKSNKCIGCGLCNYICPAKIKLKEIVRGDKDEEKDN